jgi:urease accessory protein UreF
VDAAPHTDPGGDTVNPHRLVYRLPLPRGTRAELARTDREIVARLRADEREEATTTMRINLARSVGDGWGALGTSAIDGIPGDGRMFGPVAAHRPGSMAVDAGYRAAMLGLARRAIARRASVALAAGDVTAAVRLGDESNTADRARAWQVAEYDYHAGRALIARRADRARAVAGVR